MRGAEVVHQLLFIKIQPGIDILSRVADFRQRRAVENIAKNIPAREILVFEGVRVRAAFFRQAFGGS